MGCGSSSAAHHAAVQPIPVAQTGSVKQVGNESQQIAISQAMFILENDKQVKDNYVIKNKLGEGQFGTVRRIIDKQSGEEKALKILGKNVKDNKKEQSVLQEVSILKQLDHPNVLKIFEYYQDKKNFYIVTEMMKGGELFDKLIDLSTLSEADAAFIFSQLISAVHYAHSINIVHRDIKPENILLELNEQSSTKFQIKIIDWGSATTFVEDSKLTESIGTPYYKAPEVVRGSYTSKCDVWTCGVILYMILSGEPPFFGSQTEVIQRILDIDYDMKQEVWSSISSECKDLIKSMLCAEEKRLTAKQVQEHPWMVKYLTIFKSGSQEDKQKHQLLFVKLKKLQSGNKLQQAVQTFITSQLTSKEELRQLSQLFQKLDKNNDGRLSKDEIESGFREHPEPLHLDFDIINIFSSMDTDGNGKINYSEFITACLQGEAIKSEGSLKKSFEQFDSDGNNFITLDELGRLFNNVSEQVKALEINKIFQQFDSDKDGKISYEEFKSRLKKIAETG